MFDWWFVRLAVWMSGCLVEQSAIGLYTRLAGCLDACLNPFPDGNLFGWRGLARSIAVGISRLAGFSVRFCTFGADAAIRFLGSAASCIVRMSRYLLCMTWNAARCLEILKF